MDQYVYDAFGTVQAKMGNTINYLQFAGELGYHYDTDFGSIYVRRRYLQPGSGRWLSGDTGQLTLAGFRSAYLYVNNAPVDLSDATGEQARRRVGSLRITPVVFPGSCGSFTIDWDILTSQVRLAYLVQLACVRYVFSYCLPGCGKCHPLPVRTIGCCCFERIYPRNRNLLANPQIPSLDRWRAPTGRVETGMCGHAGFILMRATLRAFIGVDVELQQWRPRQHINCGGFPLWVNEHLPSMPPPAWWDGNPADLAETGWNFALSIWNCCPKPLGRNTELIFGSSSWGIRRTRFGGDEGGDRTMTM